MKRFLAICLLVLCFVGAAWAEDVGEIQLKQDVLLVPVGKKAEVKYRLTTEALRKSSFAYEISDESIATVDYQGFVKGLALGECTLKITSKKYPEVTASVPVQVVMPVKKVIVEEKEVSMNVGERRMIHYTLEPADATIKDVTYTSTNEDVAMVYENGMVTALSRGTATITILSADGNARGSFRVTVRQLPESVTFKKDEYTFAVGRQTNFNTVVRPSNANNKKLIWSSSDESVVRVNSSGQITTVGEGTVTITAACEAAPDVKGTITIHSVNPIKSIRFDQTYYEMQVGDSVQLTPSFTPEDASAWAVTYRAANPYICHVDQSGLVTATGGGRTTVTISSNENSGRKAVVDIYIYVPAESVHFDEKGMRLPVGEHAFATAKVRPGDSTEKDMSWVSSDESVAIVTNISHRPRIEGLKWGRCTITGTTLRGGFTASLNVNVGALHEAVTAETVTASEGTVYVTLRNHSDMHLTSVTLSLRGKDGRNGSETVEVDLAPFALSEPVAVYAPAITKPEAAVSAWETDTGYYTNADELKYSYRISSGLLEWAKAE